jgi:predicted AlkP superfamily phosphohydrolase/phosphomutase
VRRALLELNVPDPHPGVDGEAYDNLRRRIADRLLALRHPRTGEPFVRRVMTREEAFPGPESARAPDLTLVLHDYGFLSVLNGADVIWPRPIPAGTHRPEGIFAARGPGIARGALLAQANIVDVAPAILHSLGLPVPTDLEGRAVDGCFDPAFLAAAPIRVEGSTRPPAGAGAPAAAAVEDEDEEVMARLRALRYIE